MKKLLIPLFLLMISTTAFSQTLEQKWGRMLEKAENYDPYKVIKKTELADFWKSVDDSISRYKKELKTERNTITKQNAEITQLKTETASLTSALADSKSNIDSVTFIGIKANKYVYLSVLTFLLLGTIVVLVLLFYIYKNSHSVASQKVTAYNNLSKEFDEYKLGKIEMERKLRRELQTQVNKLEELKKSN